MLRIFAKAFEVLYKEADKNWTLSTFSDVLLLSFFINTDIKIYGRRHLFVRIRSEVHM